MRVVAAGAVRELAASMAGVMGERVRGWGERRQREGEGAGTDADAGGAASHSPPPSTLHGLSPFHSLSLSFHSSPFVPPAPSQAPWARVQVQVREHVRVCVRC